MRYRFPPEIISHAIWLYHRFGTVTEFVPDDFGVHRAGVLRVVWHGFRRFGKFYPS